MGIDDAGVSYELADDPLRERLAAAGKSAKVGERSSAAAFRPLISNPEIMGRDLYTYGGTGRRLEALVASMLGGTGSIREAVRGAH
jgi:hypothetical protein